MVARRLVETDAHEGPVVIGDALFFTTLPAVPGRSSIRRLSLTDGALTTLAEDANGANGMTCGLDGRLVVCEQGSQTTPAAITAMDPATGAREVLVEGGLNSPNDVCVRSDGAVFFTDPTYGHVQGFRPPPEGPEAVYRLLDGELEVVGVFDKPNGIALSPDEDTLYVGDNGAGVLYADGRPIARFGGEHPDGLKVDPDGRLYASSPEGIDVLDPDGARAGRIDVPGAVNLWIEGDRIYITADTAIWTVERSTT